MTYYLKENGGYTISVIDFTESHEFESKYISAMGRFIPSSEEQIRGGPSHRLDVWLNILLTLIIIFLSIWIILKLILSMLKMDIKRFAKINFRKVKSLKTLYFIRFVSCSENGFESIFFNINYNN